jgi:tetratricopeptide (TPR) repeat protein
MVKHFTCLSILLFQLSCLTAQVNLQGSIADNRAGNSVRQNSRTSSFTNESIVALIKTISQRESEKAFIGKEETFNNYESYFKEFANNHGVTSSELKELVDQWANADSVKEAVNDFMLQGARSYYLQQFHESSLYYEQAAVLREKNAREKRNDAEYIDATFNAYLLAGNSASEGADFKKAIQLYAKADSLISGQAFVAQKKMRLQEVLAVVLYEEGSRTADSESVALLAQAVAIEQAALATYTRDYFPQDWARTQSNLGTLLQEQADRMEDSAGITLLKQSIAAYNAALTIYTKQDFRQEWARSHNNMGVVLSKLGTRGEDMSLFAQAVTAFRTALDVYTKIDFPQDWALTQYNLGNMLQLQGGYAKGPEADALFEQSANAYRSALEVYTQRETPEQWASAQHNLGTSLYEQGRHTEGTALFAQAVTAFQAALIVRTRECFPKQWAKTQYNLGTALWEESSRTATENTSLLEQSALAFKAALDIYTPEDFPEEWFNAQTNLGLLYEQKKQWPAAIQCFEKLRDIDPVYAAKKVSEVRRKSQQ